MANECVATIDALVSAVKQPPPLDRTQVDRIKELDLRLYELMLDFDLHLPRQEPDPIHYHLGKTRIPHLPFGAGMQFFPTADWLGSMALLRVEAERIGSKVANQVGTGTETTIDTKNENGKKPQKNWRPLDHDSRACIELYKQLCRRGDKITMKEVVEQFAAENPGCKKHGIRKRITANPDAWKRAAKTTKKRRH